MSAQRSTLVADRLPTPPGEPYPDRPRVAGIRCIARSSCRRRYPILLTHGTHLWDYGRVLTRSPDFGHRLPVDRIRTTVPRPKPGSASRGYSLKHLRPPGIAFWSDGGTAPSVPAGRATRCVASRSPRVLRSTRHKVPRRADCRRADNRPPHLVRQVKAVSGGRATLSPARSAGRLGPDHLFGGFSRFRLRRCSPVVLLSRCWRLEKTPTRCFDLIH